MDRISSLAASMGFSTDDACIAALLKAMKQDDEVQLSAVPEMAGLPVIESDCESEFESLEEESFTSLKTLQESTARGSVASSVLVVEPPQPRRKQSIKKPIPKFRRKRRVRERAVINSTDVVVTSDAFSSWEVMEEGPGDDKKTENASSQPASNTEVANTIEQPSTSFANPVRHHRWKLCSFSS
eukprot:TRINITY_DN18258_c0_g1_i1.p2 TRINITY_DN18258_c0_g1~~TRINITY_DN18258_c0_g1_i1.p2  ORF type:complete len:184 (+),score=45.38 TRINITY_DN18258_c0_g1_i1:80-631(+)